MWGGMLSYGLLRHPKSGVFKPGGVLLLCVVCLCVLSCDVMWLCVLGLCAVRCCVRWLVTCLAVLCYVRIRIDMARNDMV